MVIEDKIKCYISSKGTFANVADLIIYLIKCKTNETDKSKIDLYDNLIKSFAQLLN